MMRPQLTRLYATLVALCFCCATASVSFVHNCVAASPSLDAVEQYVDATGDAQPAHLAHGHGTPGQDGRSDQSVECSCLGLCLLSTADVPAAPHIATQNVVLLKKGQPGVTPASASLAETEYLLPFAIGPPAIVPA